MSAPGGNFLVMRPFFLSDRPGAPAFSPAVGSVIQLADAELIAGLSAAGRIEPADPETSKRLVAAGPTWSAVPDGAKANYVRTGIFAR